MARQLSRSLAAAAPAQTLQEAKANRMKGGRYKERGGRKRERERGREGGRERGGRERERERGKGRGHRG